MHDNSVLEIYPYNALTNTVEETDEGWVNQLLGVPFGKKSFTIERVYKERPTSEELALPIRISLTELFEKFPELKGVSDI